MLIPDLNVSWTDIVFLFMVELALLVIGLGLVWAIIKVRHEPAPAMLTISLGLLTLVCVIAFALTKQNVLGTLAATGLGALAGSLNNVLQNKSSNKPTKEEEGDINANDAE